MIGDSQRPCEWGGPKCNGTLPAGTRRSHRFCGPCACEANNAWRAHTRRGHPWNPPRLNVAGSKGAGLPSTAPSPASRRPPPPPPVPDPPHDPLPINDPTAALDAAHAKSRVFFRNPHVESVTINRDGTLVVLRVGTPGEPVQDVLCDLAAMAGETGKHRSLDDYLRDGGAQ